MKKIFAASAVALLLSACSGNVLLSPLDPKTLGGAPVVTDINTADGQRALNQGYPGLLVYLPKQVVEQDHFTQIHVLSPDKKTLILSGACDSSTAITMKVVTVVDRSRPYLLQYHHGFLETYTFQVSLTADGALSSINSQSTPDQGKTLANLTSAAASAAGVVKSLAPPKPGVVLPICTDTPVFDAYGPLPTIP